MRRAPKPWGDALWDRVESFLERAEEEMQEAEDELNAHASTGLRELIDEARAIRKEMVAENARRAGAT